MIAGGQPPGSQGDKAGGIDGGCMGCWEIDASLMQQANPQLTMIILQSLCIPQTTVW
jgi:hypothetical protein